MSWGSPAAAPTAANDGPKSVFYLGVDITGRSRYQSFLEFTSKTVAERTKVGSRNTVAETRAQVNAYHTSQGACIVMITEPTYKRMDAQAFLSKVADAFQSNFTPTEIKTKQPPFSWPEIAKLRQQAVTAEKDGIGAVQQELDETKVILHKTIESVLERGEKLDTLVAKSDELGAMSKGFYKQAKQQNACCVVM
ncbi:palmitoyltransferase [Knufia obscura]|uniref:Palmitoyltransferase n=1 Tax=Knufia obscura TaxID=1635080 RepID=A0ABR0REB4_9EURO|nr:palmitoyltransferase [Knufia obscura]